MEAKAINKEIIGLNIEINNEGSAHIMNYLNNSLDQVNKVSPIKSKHVKLTKAPTKLYNTINKTQSLRNTVTGTVRPGSKM